MNRLLVDLCHSINGIEPVNTTPQPKEASPSSQNTPTR